MTVRKELHRVVEEKSFHVSSCLDQVTRVSRIVSVSEPATTPPATDVEMEDRGPEPEPVRAPTRKRKPKKEVPVGRNGLKKKRVVKSRMTTDKKGYFGAP